MDYLQRLISQTKSKLFLIVLIENLAVFGSFWVGYKELALSNLELVGFTTIIAIVAAGLVASSLGRYLMQPIEALWQAVMHLSPEGNTVSAPDASKLSFGKELVTDLTSQIYQIVSSVDKLKTEASKSLKDLSHNFVAQNLPLPLFVLDSSETIKYANPVSAEYVGIPIADLLGKNVYMVLDMAFPSSDTFDNWLKKVKSESATAAKYWERVKLDVRDNHPTRLFDLAAYYNRDNPEHNDTMLILFDHTSQYSQDEQAISFLALSVHELRAPLTMLRGYIELLEEELNGNISQELQVFIEKMRVQAEQLMAFINNILNVARVDDDQLELKLEETDWLEVLKSAIENLSLRAKVRGITLHCKFAKNLPKVGVDQLSIIEVVNNLVDNAIKYSAKSRVINIETYLSKEGLIETTVQDFGVGVPTSIINNLFTKYYRDHHNRAQIGGTGLGLYLSKAIIKAHGGNLWVRSREGEGSTFGFTLLPYSNLSEDLKQSGDKEITRSAHGWIKNHSLYRR